jgi:Cof subfamily protein (haloacid dehalogenase superfamily)
MVQRIALLVTDIDGTLLTPDKRVTPEAAKAVADLKDAGIRFTVVSSRPPRGLTQLVAQLGVAAPYASFNGATLQRPGGGLLQVLRLSPEAAKETLALFAGETVEPWIFADDLWLSLRADGPYTDRERLAVGFSPTVVETFEPYLDRVDKILGVSGDTDHLADVETTARRRLGDLASATRSHPYYLDITHPTANKGYAVKALAAEMGVDLAATAVIGDQGNDVSMFAVVGLSIAMGQASAEIQASADAVTSSNSDNGFADAVTKLVLPRA